LSGPQPGGHIDIGFTQAACDLLTAVPAPFVEAALVVFVNKAKQQNISKVDTDFIGTADTRWSYKKSNSADSTILTSMKLAQQKHGDPHPAIKAKLKPVMDEVYPHCPRAFKFFRLWDTEIAQSNAEHQSDQYWYQQWAKLS